MKVFVFNFVSAINLHPLEKIFEGSYDKNKIENSENFSIELPFKISKKIVIYEKTSFFYKIRVFMKLFFPFWQTTFYCNNLVRRSSRDHKPTTDEHNSVELRKTRKRTVDKIDVTNVKNRISSTSSTSDKNDIDSDKQQSEVDINDDQQPVRIFYISNYLKVC